jgi:hypothetical protein
MVTWPQAARRRPTSSPAAASWHSTTSRTPSPCQLRQLYGATEVGSRHHGSDLRRAGRRGRHAFPHCQHRQRPRGSKVLGATMRADAHDGQTVGGATKRAVLGPVGPGWHFPPSPVTAGLLDHRGDERRHAWHWQPGPQLHSGRGPGTSTRCRRVRGTGRHWRGRGAAETRAGRGPRRSQPRVGADRGRRTNGYRRRAPRRTADGR